ncbi:hypothetical protein GCM10027160_31950 [Streptomyces calidiresistens]|uniref:Uncharacterized protein n=1 Tax=Streptomyces calidiresistens TaxID=1485586 RepID=A0A7W3XUR5_9ACTN|nr:DUF6069 family protein [Streptomyces calidiresistens]MBB0228053.1 hypothetical protein [Streptomyces calidiresistens]
MSTAPEARLTALGTPPTRFRLLAAVSGALAAAAAHLIALAAGAEMLVPAFEGEGTQQIATVGVLASAFGATLIGWAVARGAERFTPRPRAAWLAFAAVGLLLSFVPVIAIDATGLTRAVLALQHLLVAVIVIPVFARTLPRDAGSPAAAPTPPT